MMYRTLAPIIAVIAMAATVQGELHAQFVWKQFGDLGQGRNFFGAVPIGNGKVLVAGGYSQGGYGTDGQMHPLSRPTASCEIIDAATGAITPTASMPAPRAEAVFLLTPDSNVVAISGIASITGGEIVNECELYDRNTGTWSAAGRLQRGRRQHAACFINNDEFIVVGGRGENLNAMANAEIVNIRTRTTRRIADYPYPSSSLVAATTPDGRIVAFAGRESGSNSYRDPNVYAYDTSSNTWVVADVLPRAMNAPHLLKMRNGDLVLSGGALGENPLTLSNSVFRWSGSGSGFTKAGEMEAGRVWHSQAQVGDNTIIITGGWPADAPATRNCDLIDLSTGERTAGPQLRTARRYSQTVSVPVSVGGTMEMRVLAIAGQDERAATLASVEVLSGTLLDAETGEFMGEEGICPNPASDRLSLRLNLSTSSPVRISLTDMLGNEVMRAEEPAGPGSYSRDLSLRDLPTGVYLLRVRSGKRTLVRKIVRE